MHTKITWIEPISGDGASDTHYFDFAQIFSKFNRKQLNQVDGKGNAQCYLIKIRQNSVSGSDSAEIHSKLYTAPNNYVTKQAVKRWHQARVDMFAKHGVKMKTLSPYARNLRVAYDVSAPVNGTTDSDLYAGVPERSTFVQSAQFDEANSTALTNQSMVDAYNLTLLGPSVTTGTSPTIKYSTVGVNASWLLSRRKPYTVPDSSAEAGQTAKTISSNPLLEIQAASGVATAVITEAKDEQVQEPPWDDSDHSAEMQVANLYSAINTFQETIIEVPLGLMKAISTDLRSSNVPTMVWDIELLDVYDM